MQQTDDAGDALDGGYCPLLVNLRVYKCIIITQLGDFNAFARLFHLIR